MTKKLLHCCCGPCTCGAIAALSERNKEFTAYFFNPNIHPYKEYQARRDSFVELMRQQNIEYILNDDYSLENWLSNVAAEPQNRCAYCYRSRLYDTAQTAAQNGFESFSTTLLISPYQNHQLLIETGENAAKKYGVNFDYIDLRPYFRSGQNAARTTGLYMQKYCGCIYSEKERYLNTKKVK